MGKQQFLKQYQREGEEYAGLILGEDGNPDYHLFLLPGKRAGIDHEAATVWAERLGGELPIRREQSLLFANLRRHFRSGCYWSSEKQADTGWVWYQNFSYGEQSTACHDDLLHARAVRRVFVC